MFPFFSPSAAGIAFLGNRYRVAGLMRQRCPCNADRDESACRDGVHPVVLLLGLVFDLNADADIVAVVLKSPVTSLSDHVSDKAGIRPRLVCAGTDPPDADHVGRLSFVDTTVNHRVYERVRTASMPKGRPQSTFQRIDHINRRLPVAGIQLDCARGSVRSDKPACRKNAALVSQLATTLHLTDRPVLAELGRSQIQTRPPIHAGAAASHWRCQRTENRGPVQN
jgi:hypothetical protein